MSPPATQTTCITPAGFVAHFKNKVDAIRASTAGAPPSTTGRTCSSSLSSYSRVTSQDIERLLSRSPSKQCVLDPAPTWLVKVAGTTMTTILVKLVNAPPDSGTFPSSMKHAIVTPVVKKPGMDSSSLSNYRPISNLPFVSKLLERAVAHQLTTYLRSIQTIFYQLVSRLIAITIQQRLHSCLSAMMQCTTGRRPRYGHACCSVRRFSSLRHR